MPCPQPEQLPPAGTARAHRVHELESPLAAPLKMNLHLRQPARSTPVCTKLSPLCSWGQSSGGVRAPAGPSPAAARGASGEPGPQLPPGSAPCRRAGSVGSRGPRPPHGASQRGGGVPLPGSGLGTDRHGPEARAAGSAAARGSFLCSPGNSITARAGREPGSTAQRDGLHSAY